MQNIEQTFLDITGINLELFLFRVVVVLIGWYISQNAKNSIPRLIFVFLGLYLYVGDDSIYRYIGIGFILAHTIFLFYYIKIQYDILKEASINSYYFMLTILGKILNIFKWIVSFFEAIKIFITTFNFKKAKNNYEQENPNEGYQETYKNYYEEQNNYNDTKQEYKQKEENKQEYKSKQDNSYKEQKQDYKQESKSEYKQSSSSNKTNSSNPTGKEEYNQFFSSSKYTILGVDMNTPFKDINREYKKLAKRFHPDLGTEKEETGLVIKRINLAYECVKAKNKNSTTHKCEFCGGY